MSRYYGMDGQPLSRLEWARLIEGGERIVARTDLPGGFWVSTVLLGIDHNFSDAGPPIIFETMVFGPDDMGELDVMRYATREEAQAGHEAMVARHREVAP